MSDGNRATGDDGSPPSVFHRSRWRRLERFGLPVALGLIVLVIALGLWGFSRVPGATGTFFDRFYEVIQLFYVNAPIPDTGTPWQLQITRFLAPALVAYAVVTTVLLVARDQVNLLLTRGRRDHIVVVGLNQASATFARSAQHQFDLGRVVGVDADDSSPTVDALRDSGITVVGGDATLASTLRSARADRARRVVIWAANDSTNLRILGTLRRMDGSREVPAQVMISSPTTWAELASVHTENLAGVEPTEYLNFAELTAQVLLRRFHDDLRAKPPTRSDELRHVAVRGTPPWLVRLTVHLLRAPQIPKRDEQAGEPGATLLLQGPNAPEAERTLHDTDRWVFDAAESVKTGPEVSERTGVAFIGGLSSADSIGTALSLARQVPRAMSPRLRVYVAVGDQRDADDLQPVVDRAREGERIVLVPMFRRISPRRLLEQGAFERLPAETFTYLRKAELWTRARDAGLASEKDLDRHARGALQPSDVERFTAILRPDPRSSGSGVSLRPVIGKAQGADLSGEELERLVEGEARRLPALLDPGRAQLGRQLGPSERERYEDWVAALPRQLAAVGYELSAVE